MLPIFPWLEYDTTGLVNSLWECALINPSFRLVVFRKIDRLVSNNIQKSIHLPFPGSIEVQFCFCTLLKKDKRPSRSVLRQSTDILIHT
jgi:hypothetical protein